MSTSALTPSGISPLQALDIPLERDVLIDLKRRIQGRFSIVEATDERLAFTNSASPFAEKVAGRPWMCIMTSNVFGCWSVQTDLVWRIACNRSV